MTYISAFHCDGGIVLCADTLETIDEEKQYSEKLITPAKGNYPIAVGGAGTDEIIEAFCQELMERVEQTPPRTIIELKTTIRESIRTVYAEDVPLAVIKRQYRTAQFIVAAKPPSDGFVLFKVDGKRVYPVDSTVIIGYATPRNNAILRRMYRSNIPVFQGVLLGAYLLAESKDLDTYVGGDTRIVIVASHGAFAEDSSWIKLLEKRSGELLTACYELFLAAADESLHDYELDSKLEEFQTMIRENRRKYSAETSLAMLEKVRNPNWDGDAYAKRPDGATITIGAMSKTILFHQKKPWLMIPDGATEDGRSRMRLVPLNSPEAKGKKS